MRGISRRLVAVAAAGLVAITAVPASTAQAHGRHGKTYAKVAYFTQWGIYGRNYQLSKVESSGQAARLTHLNYAFGNVTADGVCASFDAWADWQTPFSAELSVDGVADVAGQTFAGNFNQLVKLKKKNPKLRVLMSLGGWTGSAFFSDAVLTDASRKKLVSSCVDLWIKGNLPGLTPGVAKGVFDGIDLDWEWPASEGNTGNVVRDQDRENFTLVVKEFRRQLDALSRKSHRHYDLTAFLPADPVKIAKGFEPKKIFRDLDFATVQGYDFHGTWETLTNQQSAIYVPRNSPTSPDFSVDVAINAWNRGGAPRSKLVVGVPYYGQGWTGTNLTNLFVGPATPAKGVFADGVEDYKVLQQLLADPAQKFTVHRDRRAGHAFITNGSTFWTYDDPSVMRQKTDYIKDKGLGGVMVWSLDGDDATGSLTRALSDGLRSPGRH
jgi:chitinase